MPQSLSPTLFPEAQNPKPQTLNPKPLTLNPVTHHEYYLGQDPSPPEMPSNPPAEDVAEEARLPFLGPGGDRTQGLGLRV